MLCYTTPALENPMLPQAPKGRGAGPTLFANKTGTLRRGCNGGNCKIIRRQNFRQLARKHSDVFGLDLGLLNNQRNAEGDPIRGFVPSSKGTFKIYREPRPEARLATRFRDWLFFVPLAVVTF